MVNLSDEYLDRIANRLQKYQAQSAITGLAAFLTLPHLQANTIRIETLVHLAVACCKGRKKPKQADLRTWLNQWVRGTWLVDQEDPLEDVFLSNVVTPNGNYSLFEGIWESNDFYVQSLLDAMRTFQPMEMEPISWVLDASESLLKLGNEIARRLDLPRWASAPSTPRGSVFQLPKADLEARMRALSFSPEDLKNLDIDRDYLEPFICSDSDKGQIRKDKLGHSCLERKPLIAFGSELVLVLPAAVSPAIRRFSLEALGAQGLGQQFSEHLAEHQFKQVKKGFLSLIRGQSEILATPDPAGPIPRLHSGMLKWDKGHFLHLVFFHDDIVHIPKEGLTSALQYPPPWEKELSQYLSSAASARIDDQEFSSGLTLIVLGGLGRGIQLKEMKFPEPWNFSLLPLPHLMTLAHKNRQGLFQFIKCINQKKWLEENGVVFSNVSGDLNFFQYWLDNAFQALPKNMPYGKPAHIGLLGDYLGALRIEARRHVDPHAIPRPPDGALRRCERFGRDSLYPDLAKRSIYVSIDDAKNRSLAGVIETTRGATWLSLENPLDETLAHTAYEIWEGLMPIFHRTVSLFDEAVKNSPPDAIEIQLDLENMVRPGPEITGPPGTGIPTLDLSENSNGTIAKIKVPDDFLTNFHQPENLGEQALVHALVRGLSAIHSGLGADVSSISVTSLSEEALGGSGSKILHLFFTNSPVDYLMSGQDMKLELLKQEDVAFHRLGLMTKCLAGIGGSEIEGTEAATNLLNSAVATLWSETRQALQELDRASVLRATITNLESLSSDRDRWKRTARAQQSIYGQGDDVMSLARSRELERSVTGLATRAIAEMALCESPLEGKKDISATELDNLVARLALLVNIASDSDAIHKGLATPKVVVFENGDFQTDHGFQESVLIPYISGHMDRGFSDAVGSYEKHYKERQKEEVRPTAEIYGQDFSDAFEAEYEIGADSWFDAIAELLEIGVEQQQVMVEAPLSEVHRRLIENRGLDAGQVDAFFRAFSLQPRKRWDKLPHGYRRTDIMPWRFGRRLSLVMRPLILTGPGENAPLLYGLGMLQNSVNYVFSRLLDGDYPGEFCTTDTMRSFLGGALNRHGREFEVRVAKRIEELGWQARQGVKARALQAPHWFGDIDVLAWNELGDVVIIECKRLRMAKTIGEIANQLEKFRGEEKDKLALHLRRVNWVEENPASLGKVIDRAPSTIRNCLVVSTDVPMMYLEDLPISPGDVVPFHALDKRLKR
jgi:hypothetical protein